MRNETIYTKKGMVILKKTLAAFVAGVFVFTSTIGWAQEDRLFSTGIEKKSSSCPADKDKLAPQLRLTLPEFKDRYLNKATILAHEATNKHIEQYFHDKFKGQDKVDIEKASQEDLVWRKDLVDIKINSRTDKQEILIISIPNLLKNTGQLAHVGLGRVNKKPVIYADSQFYYNEDVLLHEKDEIGGWEARRRERGFTYENMRQWIIKHVNIPDPVDGLTSRDVAKNIHNSSHNIDRLYNQIKLDNKKYFALDDTNSMFYTLYFDYGLDEDSTDVNIAAKAPNEQSSKGGLDSPEQYDRIDVRNELTVSANLVRYLVGSVETIREKVYSKLPEAEAFAGKQITYKGLTLLRKKDTRGQEYKWVFKKSDLELFARVFELKLRPDPGVLRVQPDEYPVASSLERVFTGKGKYLADKILGALGSPEVTGVNEKTHRGVIFVKRKTRGEFVWAFKKTAAHNVADIFGFSLKPATPQASAPFSEDRYIVLSEAGFRNSYVEFRKWKKIKVALDRIIDKQENHIINSGVRFFKVRQADGKIAWAILKTDENSFISTFGFSKRIKNGIPGVENDDISVSSSLETYFVGKGDQIEEQIEIVLGKAENSNSDIRSYSGVDFARKLVKGKMRWTFKKAAAEDVARVFKLKLRKDDVDELKDDEIIISRNGLEKYIYGTAEKSDEMNNYLNKANTDNLARIVIQTPDGEMEFYRRRNETRRVWAFKTKDLAIVAGLFGLKIIKESDVENTRKVSALCDLIRTALLEMSRDDTNAKTEQDIGEVNELITSSGRILSAMPTPDGGTITHKYTIYLVSNQKPKLTKLSIAKKNNARLYYIFSYVLNSGEKNTIEFYWDLTQKRLVRVMSIKERKLSTLQKATELFKKYDVLDLAVSLSNNPEEMQQALAILLTHQGVELNEKEFAELSRAFILNLREGYKNGGNAEGPKPGDPIDYLRALMALQKEIQTLESHEKFILMRAFIRLSFPRFAKDFNGTMQEIKDAFASAKQNNPFLDELIQYTQDILGQGLQFQPKHIKTTLLPHQRVGAWAMRESEKYQSEGIYGFLLEDDTRLGKTIQTYAAMDPSWKVVVAVPAGVMDTWQEQFYQHTDRSMKLFVVRGTPAQKHKILEETKDQKGLILLISLEDLRGKSDDEFECINQGLGLVVVDEGQRIENYGGQELKTSSLQARSVHKFKSPRRWVLSGSPYTSHPSQLFSVFNLLHTNPQTGEITNPLYSSRREFNKLLTGSLKQMRWLYALKARIGLRRTKNEMGTIYSKKKEVAPAVEGYYEITPDQAQLVLRIIHNLGKYLKIYNNRVGPEDRFSERSIGVFLKLQFLTWALTDPSVLGENVATNYWDAMDELVEKRLKAKRKGIIYAQNTIIIDRIIDRYSKKGYNIARIDGTITGDAVVDGRPVVDEHGNPISAQAYQRHLFQTDPTIDIVVMNIRSGVGLDLSSAGWELYAQLPQNYVEYYQSSDRALGLNPTANQKEVEVLFMIGRYPKEFLETTLKSLDKPYVESGTPAEVLYQGIMGKDKARFELVMEGIQTERGISEQKALTRLVHAVYGFLEDPSMKQSKKKRKEMETSGVLYPLYQMVKGNGNLEEQVLSLVEFFSKTEVSPLKFAQAVAGNKNFDFNDLQWINSLSDISNKHHRDMLLGMVPDILKKIWAQQVGLNELVERGPPALKTLAASQPELLIPFAAAMQCWSSKTNIEDELEPAHPGAMVLLQILEEFYSDGFSDYDRSQWIKRFGYALINLIDLESPRILDLFSRLKEDLLSDSFSLQEKLEFFEELGILRSADSASFESILADKKDFTSTRTAIRNAMRDAVVDLFGLPDTEETRRHLFELARQWGNLNAPVQLMIKLKDGSPAFYGEHIEIFKKAFSHILDGTYAQWRNEQSSDLTGHEIDYRLNDQAFWKTFTREERVALGDIEVSAKDFRKSRTKKVEALLDLFQDEAALSEAFGALGGKIRSDLLDSQAIQKLQAERVQKGRQRSALDTESKKGRDLSQAIAILNQELQELNARLKILQLYEALESDNVKEMQRLLKEAGRLAVEPKAELADAGLHLKTGLMELQEAVGQGDKTRMFEDVEVEITSNPDFVMRRGMLNEELKNCFNLHGNVKQVAALVDDLVSRNKMLAIVRSKGRIVSVAIVKIRKTIDEKPVLMIERPLYRWGYDFQTEIAKALAQTKLSEMEDTLIAGDSYKGEAKEGRQITVYGTGTRAPEEYHETLWGLRSRNANVSHIAGVLVDVQGAKLAKREKGSEMTAQDDLFGSLSQTDKELAEGITRVRVNLDGVEHEVLGIGHSNRSEAEFINLLKNAGVKTIVDVRTNPVSRFNPHFNRRALESALKNNEIEYVWQGDKLGGKLQEYNGDFAEYMKADPGKRFTEGIRELLINIKEKPGPVCILCSEKAVSECHRQYILQYLSKLNTAGWDKGSPSDCLQSLKGNNDILRKALNREEGISISELAALRPYHPKTVYKEFKILRDLGIFVSVEGRRGYYSFANMMIGPDANYTKTLINAIADMRYQVGKKGEERPLRRWNIADDKLVTVRELVKMTVINQATGKFRPAMPENRTLWHVIERDVIPLEQRSTIVTQLNKYSRESSIPEKIRILNDGENLADVIADIRKDPNAVIDVALSDESHIPDDRTIKMLVFKSDSDFIQLGGVLDALRTLHNDDQQAVIKDLLRIYSRMTNETYKGDIPPPETLNDPREFARRFVFILPPIARIPSSDMQKINERLLKLLMSA